MKLAVLLPMTGWEMGKQIAGAASLAVDRVNADETLLAGRHLIYRWANSGCDAVSQRMVTAMSSVAYDRAVCRPLG